MSLYEERLRDAIDANETPGAFVALTREEAALVAETLWAARWLLRSPESDEARVALAGAFDALDAFEDPA